MSNVISVVKIAAKRLKKSIPNKTLMQIQDIASHAITGKSSFHELLKGSEKNSENIKVLIWGEIHEVESIFQRGNWYFYPDKQAIVLEGTKYSPYAVFLTNLKTSSELLDFILQIQSKRHHGSANWYDSEPAFETDNFISLMNDICEYYFDNRIQGVFSPNGKSKEVSWIEVVEKKEFNHKRQGE
jgi:hypothetical protein